MTFALENLTFLTITTFRTFCHLSVICVVHSDLKIVSHRRICKGRSKSVVGPENINAVQKLTMQDRHMTYCEIEVTLGISSTSIYKILYEHLAVKKICSCWIPHNLTKPCLENVSSGIKRML